jgi:hypothetical protein
MNRKALYSQRINLDFFFYNIQFLMQHWRKYNYERLKFWGVFKMAAKTMKAVVA